jgi:hypothetical protein
MGVEEWKAPQRSPKETGRAGIREIRRERMGGTEAGRGFSTAEASQEKRSCPIIAQMFVFVKRSGPGRMD